MEEVAEHVDKIKSSMMADVYVMKDFIKYLENVEHVILFQPIKMEIVCVIMDTMEIEIFVNRVIQLVEHVVDQEPINV